MEKSHKIAVILPVFNREKYVSRAISSVLKQTYSNFELIIVDDFSTDGTQSVISQFSDPRIKYLKNVKNLGVAASRNKGVLSSDPSVEWIAAIDSDDEYHPDHLAERVAFLSQNSDMDYSYGTMDVVGDGFVPDKDDPTKMIPISETSQGATIFVKKSVFLALGGYRDVYGEDGDLLERAISEGYEVLKCPAKTYVYHRGLPDSLTYLAEHEKDKKSP